MNFTSWAEFPDSIQNLLIVLLLFALAGIVHLLAGRIARHFLKVMAGRQTRPERLDTMQNLTAGVISALALGLAVVLSLSLVVGNSNLLWFIGLFSAGLGFGMRPVVSDFIHGFSFLFEDAFDVGEKVQMLGLGGGMVEGTIEVVNLRTTHIRAVTGELYTVPNGEIRVVRNFSRGRFSTVTVKLKVSAADLKSALDLLEGKEQEGLERLPNLLEPWQILSETGELGESTELTLTAKARFGRGAEMRPRLLTLIQEWFTAAGIELQG
jgi:small conductance mechanosensitive channel